MLSPLSIYSEYSNFVYLVQMKYGWNSITFRMMMKSCLEKIFLKSHNVQSFFHKNIFTSQRGGFSHKNKNKVHTKKDLLRALRDFKKIFVVDADTKNETLSKKCHPYSIFTGIISSWCRSSKRVIRTGVEIQKKSYL